MKKTFFLLISLLLPALSQAQTTTKTYETFAIGGFFLIAVAGIAVYYFVWKNSKKHEKSGEHEKYKIKTFEVIKNGRKVVMTKKYRVTDAEEFPEDVRRKKS